MSLFHSTSVWISLMFCTLHCIILSTMGHCIPDPSLRLMSNTNFYFVLLLLNFVLLTVGASRAPWVTTWSSSLRPWKRTASTSLSSVDSMTGFQHNCKLKRQHQRQMLKFILGCFQKYYKGQLLLFGFFQNRSPSWKPSSNWAWNEAGLQEQVKKGEEGKGGVQEGNHQHEDRPRLLQGHPHLKDQKAVPTLQAWFWDLRL